MSISSKSQSKFSASNQPLFLTLWNGVVLISAFTALFFLFTNGIPFVQWGLIPEFGGKSVYVNMMRISVSIFFALLGFVYWKYPSIFDQLWVVRCLQSFFQVPLWVILPVISLAYTVILSTTCLVRHQNGLSGGDLAVFAQAVWNTTQGDFLYSSIKDGICLLGDHFSPILVLVTPLYYLWQDPQLLIVFQVISTAVCIFLVGLIAKEKLQSDFIAVIFALMYFFYYHARVVLHEDFHPEVLAEPFMLLAFISLEKKQIFWFLTSLLVVMTGKENMMGISFMLGFYAFAFKKMRWLGFIVMLCSVGLLFFELKWAIPHLNFGGRGHDYSGYYEHWYRNLGIKDVGGLFNGASPLIYILNIYSPFSFIPFFHLPTLFLTFPILFQNLLSRNENMHTFGFHYTAGIHPFLFIACIYGFYALVQKFKWFSDRKILMACLLFFFMLLRSGPSEYFYFWNFSKFKVAQDTSVREQIQAIPSQSSVLTQGRTLLQLINRKNIYILDSKAFPVGAFAKKHKIDYVILDPTYGAFNKAFIQECLRDLKNYGYSVEFEQDGFYILRNPVQSSQ